MNNLLDFNNYILESKSIYKLDNETKSKLLVLDEKYHTLIETFRSRYVAQTVSNIKEEFDKFMNAKSKAKALQNTILEIKNTADKKEFNRLVDKLEKDTESLLLS